MAKHISFDHCVIHVSDWSVSRKFYCDVLGAEAIPVRNGFAFRFGNMQLNCHGPGQIGEPRARMPVMPGNSDLCFEWHGTIEEAIAARRRRRARPGGALRCAGPRHQRLFP